MTKDEVIHLSDLARIKLTDEEVASFQSEIDDILNYVSAIQGIVGDNTAAPTVPAVNNVMRSDEVTNKPGQYTDVLLEAAPNREGNYIAVPKILQQTD